MRKKIIIAVAALTVSVAAIAGLSTFSSQTETPSKVESHKHNHGDCQGEHCTYTVGCDCSGFQWGSGDEWERYYCKKCGHHKKYHR